ncbi:MAG: NAAT family transporter [Desulfobulbaceae bacterium]|nr:NAAT family transporter [Desulfobulbaceae bacterium]
MSEYTEYLKILVALVAIVNPIGAIPIYVSLSLEMSEQERGRMPSVISVAVVSILLAALFFGEMILSFFGITIDSFRVGGGILLLILSISMLHAQTSATKHTSEEMREGGEKESAAIVPLSTPLLAGPGAISSVILYSQKSDSVIHYGLIAVDILGLGLLLWVALKLTPWISKNISKTGINIFTRLMGLVLAAIAVEFIAGGLKGLFPILA